tara:strand:+ start:678 stop:1022 length:345 start_codon:yes stop_codon:yes gene_type:complete
MTNKDEIVKVVKKWVSLNNEINMLQKQIKSYKQEKQELSKLLIDIMSKNDVECFDTQSGKILYKKVKVKSSINNKHLLSSLSEYFKDNDIDILDIVKHINDSRDVKEQEKIVIK